MRTDLGYIGWNGKHQKAPITFKLGVGIGDRHKAPPYGFRRFIWSAAFGYVNGFPIPAILYFCVTRTVHWRIFRWAMHREGWVWDDINCQPTQIRRTSRK